MSGSRTTAGSNGTARAAACCRPAQASDYTSGSIQRVNIETGAVETVYTECDGIPLKGPNDIVFDSAGGFWFSDLGKNREFDRDLGALYYARTDGSHISRAVFPIPGGANGVGLAPDDTHVYIAETPTGRLFGWEVAEPGVLASDNAAAGFNSFIANAGGYTLFDSLAVEESGRVCVATIGPGGDHGDRSRARARSSTSRSATTR